MVSIVVIGIFFEGLFDFFIDVVIILNLINV